MTMLSRVVASASIVPASLKLIEDGQQVTRLVVEESFDDFFASDLAEGVEDVADGMRQRQRALLGRVPRAGGSSERVEIGSNERRYEGLQMCVQNLRIFLEGLDLRRVSTCGPRCTPGVPMNRPCA
jgi:hypothetical protein